MKRVLFGSVGLEKKLCCVVLRVEMRGRNDSDDRVNQGGLLGRVSSRVFFAASEMLFAKFW